MIRENENKDEDNGLSYVKLNSKFWICKYNYQYKSISKVVKSSKIDLSSNFEFENIELIPKIAESSRI
jgi:hypothetical protein